MSYDDGMPVDDPISAIQALNDSDDRQASPILGVAEDLLRVTKLLVPPAVKPAITLIDGAVSWLNRKRAANRNELVDVMAEELKLCGDQIGRLLIESEDHRRFMTDEMPGLVLDGLRRAEESRSKDRIGRLARILLHAAEVGPRDGADYAEEMMRVAMELGDRDIVLLNAAASADVAGPSRPVNDAKRVQRANEVWMEIPWARIGLGSDDVESIASKLQGLGLLAAGNNMAGHNTYMVLRRAHHFIAYIGSHGVPH
jgi:hypothetical protein